jgi:hypothetical protein
MVLAVDDKFIQHLLFEDPPHSTTRVEPGPRRIVATVRFVPGYGVLPDLSRSFPWKLN